jgi:hypothetical protein
MPTKIGSKATLRQAYRHLERELPSRLARNMRSLRHASARGSHSSRRAADTGTRVYAPGLPRPLDAAARALLIATDIPITRRPIGRFTMYGTRRWAPIGRSLSSMTVESPFVGEPVELGRV